MRTELPNLPSRFARQYPDVWKSFEKLASLCHEAGPLDAKTRRLVKLGIALGAGLEGSVHAQVRNALAEKITPAELRHVMLLGLTTVGFPASMAAFAWINDVLGNTRRKRKKSQ